MFTFLRKNSVIFCLLVAVILISGVSHGYNMFRFPYYEDDEGTYMSQAWAVSTLHSFSPTVYTYDHSPLGWVIIAAWTMVSGGFFSFGPSVNSGRVLMLILHILSAVLLFYITKKLTKNNYAAFIATGIFSLTPLGIYYFRRVLLDNIMVFWVLLSLALLLGNRNNTRYLFSAICLGLATLSKEPAVFFLPAFLYIAYDTANQKNKTLVVIQYLVGYFTVVSLYFLYALTKGELFTQLIPALMYQVSRNGQFFLIATSDFMINLAKWSQDDIVLIVSGAAAILINLLFAVKSKTHRYISVCTLSFLLFILHGGVVIGFYIVPLIPFLALSIAAVLYKFGIFISQIFHNDSLQYIPLLLFILYTLWYNVHSVGYTMLYTQDQTTNQKRAIQWIQGHVPSGSLLAIDNYAFVDLNRDVKEKHYTQGGAFYYWKLNKDLLLYLGKSGTWRDIDYLLVSPQMLSNLSVEQLSLVNTAYIHSVPIQSYKGNNWDIEITKVIK
jgi:hypothetical protein